MIFPTTIYTLTSLAADGLSISMPSLFFAITLTLALIIAYFALRRGISRKLLLAQVKELEALRKTGRALSNAELDIHSLCELIANEAGKVIDNNTFQIGVFEGPLYHILFWRLNGRSQLVPRTFDLEENGGIIGWVRRQRQALLVGDFIAQLDDLPAKPRYISETPPRSGIFIPLIGGDDVIGVLAAQSVDPHRFNNEDLRILTIFANQAAAAIANARLFQQMQKQAAHLHLVGQIARQINVDGDLDNVFDLIVGLIRERFGFHPVNIFSLHKESGNAILIASTAPQPPDGDWGVASGAGLIGTAVTSQQTIIANNVGEDHRYLPYNEEDLIVRSEISVPIVAQRGVMGVLDIQSDRLGAFGKPEKAAFEALADEIAVATEKARQSSRQRQQAWVTSAQLQVANAIDATRGLNKKLAAITRLTVMLGGVSRCVILLWDNANAVYRGAAQYGLSGAEKTAFKQTILRVGDWGALDALHIGGEPLTTEKIPPWAKTPRAIPSRLLPIQTETTLGAMLVSGETTAVSPLAIYPDPPLHPRRELLQNIAGQAAVAIESAQLRIAQREEAWVNTALLQVAEAVNSRIDVNEILSAITRLIPMLVGVKSALILFWDEEKELFSAGPAHGVGAMGLGLLQSQEIKAGDLPMGEQQTNPHDITPIAPPAWLSKTLDTTAVYALPLVARGRLVGAMLAGAASEEQSNKLSPRRLSILNGIAHQAATAVVNNHLYLESAERAKLEQELDVARTIQASLIPNGRPPIPGCSVASYWQAARQVSGDFYDFLELENGRWGIVVADVADKGVPAAIFMALSRTILRTVAFNRTDPAQTLIRVNEIIDKDAASDLFVTVFYAIWDPEARELTYASGGHNPPLLLRKNGETELLKAKGMALGVLPAILVETKVASVAKGDAILFYTDGVTEAMNEDYDEFGMERLRVAARSAQLKNAETILETITTAIDAHTGATPQFDDITLVVMKIN